MKTMINILILLAFVGCVSIPKPQIDIQVNMPEDVMKACVDAGNTLEECAFYMCSSYFPNILDSNDEYQTTPNTPEEPSQTHEGSTFDHLHFPTQ